MLRVGFTCCFTGHRPSKFSFGNNENHPDCVALKKTLEREIEQMIQRNQVHHFITGMALGTDQWAAEIVLRFKEKYPFLTLEAAIPCQSQPAKWPEADQTRYYTIYSKCDTLTVLQEHYSYNCMKKRNEYMINKSDYVLAIFNGNPGGTRNSILYAQRIQKHIKIISVK